MRIRIKEYSQDDQLLNQLKSQMGSLLSNIEDTLEDKTQEQKEGLLTVASIAIAMPSILGLISVGWLVNFFGVTGVFISKSAALLNVRVIV